MIKSTQVDFLQDTNITTKLDFLVDDRENIKKLIYTCIDFDWDTTFQFLTNKMSILLEGIKF